MIKTTYFMHYCMEFAISIGWNFDGCPAEFVLNSSKKDSVAMSIPDCHITEGDVANAALGVATENFKEFWTKYTSSIYEDAKDDAVVQQSMHSGSSDYLYVKDVKEMVKGFENA